ncbi:MAG TPA: right-handed parallel beta-helix repeat-containing protein, partial [Bacillota bacterium]|nr:right-handed parallel beta-helix repeat-containing protein [Bacillota bacterium]
MPKFSVSCGSLVIIGCLILVVFGLCNGIVLGSNLFNDDFEDGNATGWSKSGGSWTIATDDTKVFMQSSTSANAYAYSGSSSWKDYTVQARVKALSFNGTNRSFGITAYYQSTSNYYYLTLSNSNQLQLGKKAGSGSAVLASKAFTVQTGKWYTLKLTVNGNQLQAFVDGVLQLSATDTALKYGKAGFMVVYTSAEFDDISIEGGDPLPTSSATATNGVTPTVDVSPTPTVSENPSPTPTQTQTIVGAIYVAPDGKDYNPGTIDAPSTLTMALQRLAPGGTIYLRGGTYSYSNEILIAIGNSGSSGNLKKLFAYGAEKPVLDFTSQVYSSNGESPRGIKLAGDYWHFRGIEIKGAADNGLYVCGDHNLIELCVFHHNRDSGLQISRYDDNTPRSDWPSYNLILNCTSFDNRDPDEEDADGFACKLTSGDGNVFRGCIAYHNCDDGWDLFTKPATGPIGEVLIEN